MSPALNRSSALKRFERGNAVKIRKRIMFHFYPELPHIRLKYNYIPFFFVNSFAQDLNQVGKCLPPILKVNCMYYMRKSFHCIVAFVKHTMPLSVIPTMYNQMNSRDNCKVYSI